MGGHPEGKRDHFGKITHSGCGWSPNPDPNSEEEEDEEGERSENLHGSKSIMQADWRKSWQEIWVVAWRTSKNYEKREECVEHNRWNSAKNAEIGEPTTRMVPEALTWKRKLEKVGIWRWTVAQSERGEGTPRINNIESGERESCRENEKRWSEREMKRNWRFWKRELR